ncbi:putative DNA helicase MCM9 [Porphyridium purpureum]|uniref:Putative DNA helicase MCM9 n=1 Tax=Porphyridium purpureum TaxID=35688 RepID=A0A5J4YMC9_PORPP|nr:putative DNA helicase MCM9 [Porphyridium purpureum]|eukprot:POR2523..scf249_10
MSDDEWDFERALRSDDEEDGGGIGGGGDDAQPEPRRAHAVALETGAASDERSWPQQGHDVLGRDILCRQDVFSAEGRQPCSQKEAVRVDGERVGVGKAAADGELQHLRQHENGAREDEQEAGADWLVESTPPLDEAGAAMLMERFVQAEEFASYSLALYCARDRVAVTGAAMGTLAAAPTVTVRVSGMYDFSAPLAAYVVQHPDQAVAQLERVFLRTGFRADPHAFEHDDAVKIRLFDIPHRSAMRDSLPPSVRSLRKAHDGSLVQLTGTVVRVGAVRSQELWREMKCIKCAHRFVLEADMSQPKLDFNPPRRCPSVYDRPCTGTTFRMTRSGTVNDYQIIRLQDKPDAGARPPAPLIVSQVASDNVGDPHDQTRVAAAPEQVPVGDRPADTTPCSIAVVLCDELADTLKAGDDAVICGKVFHRWVRNLVPNSRATADYALLASHVENANAAKDATFGGASDGRRLDPALIDSFESFWGSTSKWKNKLKLRDIIVRSVCPQLHGMYLVKLIVLLTLIGGCTDADALGAANKHETAAAGAKVDDTSTPSHRHHQRVRSISHLLMVGDVGTGKSQLLRFASRLSTRGVLTTGIGSSAAGLTVTASREAGSNGEWGLEAGALVLADGGLCCIDEFDSMKSSERAAMHEAMEQQTLSVAKAGMVSTLQCRTTVIAAINPRTSAARLDSRSFGGGDHQQMRSQSLHVGMAAPLMSRFDVVLVLRDLKNKQRDEQLCEFILDGFGFEEERGSLRAAACADELRCDVTADGLYKDGDERLSKGNRRPVHTDDQQVDEYLWGIADLRAYLAYVRRRFHPRISKAASTVLRYYYQGERQAQGRNAARTTVRLLQSLMRLTQAHARLMYRQVAVVQDAMFAIMAVEASLNSSNQFLRDPDCLLADFPSHAFKQYKSFAQTVLVATGLEGRVPLDETEEDVLESRDTDEEATALPLELDRDDDLEDEPSASARPSSSAGSHELGHNAAGTDLGSDNVDQPEMERSLSNSSRGRKSEKNPACASDSGASVDASELALSLRKKRRLRAGNGEPALHPISEECVSGDEDGQGHASGAKNERMEQALMPQRSRSPTEPANRAPASAVLDAAGPVATLTLPPDDDELFEISD